MTRSALFLALLAGSCSLALSPAAASAACTSSTENSQAFADGLGDDEAGLAPDISAVIMATTAGCATGGSLSLADGRDSMIYGESTGMYFDVDNNPATGSKLGFKGADRVVITIGYSGADSDPGVGVYNPATDSFDFGVDASPVDVGIGGWTWGIDQIGFLSPSIGVSTIAMYEGTYDNYSDFSPEPGAAFHNYGVSFGTGPASAPAPAPPVPAAPATAPPAQPVATQTPATTSAPAFVCRPGKVRGLKLKAARSKVVSRGCDVKVKFKKTRRAKRGRVLSSSVRGDTVTLVVGKAGARARRAAAARPSFEELSAAFVRRAAARAR